MESDEKQGRVFRPAVCFLFNPFLFLSFLPSGLFSLTLLPFHALFLLSLDAFSFFGARLLFAFPHFLLTFNLGFLFVDGSLLGLDTLTALLVLHSHLVIVNGAISSQEACEYTVTSGTTPPNHCAVFDTDLGTTVNDYDTIKADQLSLRGLSESQVQAIWLKEADVKIIQDSQVGSLGCTSCPQGADAYNLETNLGKIVRAAKIRYPNLRMVFLTSRSYGGFTTFTPASLRFQPCVGIGCDLAP